MLCTVQGIYSCAKGICSLKEREMGNYGAAAAAVWRRVCLCSLISAVTGNIIQKTKSCTFLCVHPLVARTRQDPWFSPSHSFAFLPAKLSRADTGICSSPCQGLPRKDAGDVLDILELLCGELQEPTANHISISHHPTLYRFGPAASQLRRRDVRNHCLVPAPLQASSSACPGLELLSHLSLAIGTLCTWPALLALPAECFRVIFLGTLVLKMTMSLSFGRSLLVKVEISKPSQIYILPSYTLLTWQTAQSLSNFPLLTFHRAFSSSQCIQMDNPLLKPSV